MLASPARRILVVDDDDRLRRALSRGLADEGFVVDEAPDGAAALQAVEWETPDLVVLDLALPGMSGLDVLAALRRRGDLPVIVVTGRNGETDRIVGLDLGADDYVTKPFSQGELAARIRSVLRRAKPAGPSGAYEVGDVTVDPATREVRVAGRLVETTAREFDLLAFLAASPRRVFTRADLLEQVWGSSARWQDPSTVTQHVHRLRHKIEADPDHPAHLVTVRGVGYRCNP